MTTPAVLETLPHDEASSVAESSQATTEGTTTLVWRYGLLAPTLEAETVAAQISAAHRYQNTLIEIERRTREKRQGFLNGSTPQLAEITAAISTLETELEAARNQLAAERSAARSKKAGDPTHAKNLGAQLKKARADRKLVLKEALNLPATVAGLEAINEQRKQEVKAARAACGVYWGTYLQIEAAVEQAAKGPTPPRFQPWTGEGSVAVQLQGGLSCSEATSCTDTRLQIQLAPDPVPGRNGKPLPRVRLRVSTKENRDPVFAEWPLVLHRPLPEGGIIKWAKAVRRRVAAHDKWSLHLTLEVRSRTDSTDASAIAVNLRWARSGAPDAPIISADWTDGASKGELLVDPAIVSMIRKADDLRSIRDKNFERARASLLEAKKTLTLPEEHTKRLEHLHAWRAPGKLAAFALFWRQNRIAGDDNIFATIEAWRKQDKHLWEWEANARRKALARRRDAYRCFAAEASRSHNVLVIEKLNIARLAEHPNPEQEDDSSPAARAQRFATAPSELRSALFKAFRRNGGRVIEVPAGMPSGEMLTHYLQQKGSEVAAPKGRSARFKRLRKQPTSEPPTT